MLNYVPLEDLVASDMPHMVFAQNLLGTAGTYWMGIITLLAGISTINTVLGSVTRILSGMADANMMPALFSKKSKKGTPIAGLVLMVSVISFILITGLANNSGLTNLLLAAGSLHIS